MNRRRHLRQALVVMLAVALSGCASLVIDSYARRDLDFRRYRTFGWGARADLETGDPRLDNNQFFEEHMRARIEAGLESRGLTVASDREPDLVVHYHASVAERIDLDQIDRRYQQDAHDRPTAMVFDAGTLFVDLIDARSQHLVWRGWAEGSLQGVIDNQALLESRVNEAVTRILARLPPRL